MAENKNSFIIYTDWKQDFEFLTNEEAGKLIKHLLQYASDEKPSLENEDRLLQFAAQKMKAVMKKDLKKYEEICRKKAEAGRKGGINSGKSRSSKHNEANEANASIGKQNEHDNDNDNDNDNDIIYDNSDDGNFALKNSAKSFLKTKQQIQMDRLKMKLKFSTDELHDKIDEFVEKKFDWGENNWKNNSDMAKNFEFWLDKNAYVVVNPFKTWTPKQFGDEVKKITGVKNSDKQQFYDHYSQKAENGSMRFQNFDAWDTEKMLQKWVKNNKKPA